MCELCLSVRSSTSRRSGKIQKDKKSRNIANFAKNLKKTKSNEEKRVYYHFVSEGAKRLQINKE